MRLRRVIVVRAAGSIAFIAVALLVFSFAIQRAKDAEGFYSFTSETFATVVVGITALGAAVGNLFRRPYAGAAVGFVMSSMAFIVWWIRCAMVLVD